jgi:hypothetical protein
MATNDSVEIGTGIHEVSDAEGLAILDNAARHYLNMSGEEFLRAWKEGRFDNVACNDPGVTYVSMLIPFGEK